MRHPPWIGVLMICAGPWLAPASAHPMPNTAISVSIDDDGVRFDVAVPVPELRLALPGSMPRNADLLAEPHRSVVIAYFMAHCAVQAANGPAAPLTVDAVTLSETRDHHVGVYQELRVRMFAAANTAFDPRDFIMRYDAVIHQVPNHFALVQVVRDFRGGLLADDHAVGMGIIRFDFVRNEVPPLVIVATPASLWTGFRGAAALGFHHVATGFDHLLFLITLLVVAPLRARDGKWSLFQGWTYAARRFLAISVAFTLGHSVALLSGAYALVPVPREANEVLIALSIVLAAIHAIRPLFAGREWLVAAAFGVVHGLAFSESLAEMLLTPWIRAVAVGGFNLGVEGAQLVAMACAVPLLAASRWRLFDAIRIVTMVCVALLAGVWMIERGQLLFALPTPVIPASAPDAAPAFLHRQSPPASSFTFRT